MKRFLATVLAGAFVASSALAFPVGIARAPGLRTTGFQLGTVGAALAGDCANSLSSISGTLVTCTDFYNGAYYATGAAQATFAGAGGSVGGCAITGASGLVCTGTNVASIPGGNPASNYCMIVKAIGVADTTVEKDTHAALGATMTGAYDLTQGGGSGTLERRTLFLGGSSVVNAAASSSAVEAAICPGTTSYVSIAGAVATSSTNSTPAAASTLYFGNTSDGGNPNGAATGNFVLSVRIVNLPSAPTASTAQTASTL